MISASEYTAVFSGHTSGFAISYCSGKDTESMYLLNSVLRLSETFLILIPDFVSICYCLKILTQTAHLNLFVCVEQSY